MVPIEIILSRDRICAMAFFWGKGVNTLLENMTCTLAYLAFD